MSFFGNHCGFGAAQPNPQNKDVRTTPKMPGRMLRMHANLSTAGETSYNRDHAPRCTYGMPARFRLLLAVFSSHRVFAQSQGMAIDNECELLRHGPGSHRPIATPLLGRSLVARR